MRCCASVVASCPGAASSAGRRACSLFTTGAGDLVAQGVLPFGPAVWNLSGLLDDTSPLGGLVAALTGYRAAPDAVTLAAWAVYWAIVWLALHYQRRRAAQTPVARASRA
jgi:high-affinity iron transporter